MTRFEGRVAWISGAGSGLGRATSIRLASEGAKVACFDIAQDAAEKTCADIAAAGGRAAPFQVDVSDPTSVANATAGAAEAFGRVSVLVNCAGVGMFAHSHEMAYEDWARIIGVNLTGTFLMCQAALPLLLDGGGVIVNIASNAGLMSQPYSAAYCASKGGVIQLTKALADEYLTRNVRANVVAPGGISTPLQRQFRLPKGIDRNAIMKLISPMGNSEPEEIANIVAFVASDECRYMTGSVIPIDGGLTM